MKDAGDKLTEDEKKPVQEKLDELNKVKNGDDLEAVKKATESLSAAAQSIGEKLYKAAQEAEAAKAQPGGDTPPADGGETVKDAEVEGEEKK